ncbi:MAG: glycosyltransferase [Taibaiella sp.]|nr:glycosyltransferase [Taibaiella sp.]
MHLFIFLCLLLTAIYAMLMVLYRVGWQLQKEFPLSSSISSTTISIIIPARNEAANIERCIRAILAQHYPAALYEILVIDDHSDDDTYNLVNSFSLPNVRCIRLAEYVDEHENITAYKKKALTVGINNSSGELIITTDADCIALPDWLAAMAAIYDAEAPAMIIAPVDYTNNNSIVQLFQSVDFMSMQGITAATNRLGMGGMSNGANLAFSRTAFIAVNGYKGIDHIASGDDYLLLMKIKKMFPDKIAYLKCAKAIVNTTPQPDWKSLLQQRIRWASKAGKYDDRKMTITLLLVYLFNIGLVALFIAAFFNALLFTYIGIMLLVKVLFELFFAWPVAGFFNKRPQLIYLVLLQPLHILYIVLAGFLGFSGKYQWKGRTIK